ncbi:hypothetical protein EDD15DRAFT_2361749 [Pisolithus albus]|nr:hypothetical protein EDD15DRAFT_2361749 [Pisolithus albus]
MSEQQQCKVRFYRQLDIVLISPRQQPGTSSVPDEDTDISSSQSRIESKNCPSMEELKSYGEESPSPPPEMSTALRSPSPTFDLSLFERMKRAQVPKPPTPEYTRAPCPQADLAMADAGDLGDIAVRAPSPSPNMSLFERMRCAQVPSPPSLTEERVPSSQEDAEMELAEGSRDTTAGSPLPMFNLSLYERMKRAPVPKPPSPPPALDMDLFNRMRHARVPSPPSPCPAYDVDLFNRMRHAQVPSPPSPPAAYDVDLFNRMRHARVPSPPTPPAAYDVDLFNRMRDARVPSPPTPPAAYDVDLFNRMRHARVPSPPTPPAAYDVDLFNRMRDARVPSPPSPPAAYDVDLFNRMRDARVPSPPSPPTATEADTSKKLQSAEAPSPPSQREGLRIEQEDEPDRSGRIDFGDPDRARLREWFMLGLTGPSLSADDRLALERAGLANADTADDVLRALQDLKSRHVSPASAGNYPYEKTLDLHIVRTMKRIATDIQHLVENRVKSMHLGLYMIDSIDLLELSRYPNLAPDVQRYTGGPPYPTRQSAIEMAIIYWGLRVECAVVHLLGLPRVSDWPTQWFYNVLLDLKELDHLILVTVSRHSFTPMLPACFHAYLRCQEDKDRFQEEIRNIPLGAFHMIDSLAHYIPDWTQRTPNKYTGFVFPWWLHGSSNYPADFQKLRGGRVFPIAAEYFQYKWPTANPSIGDKVDTWIQGQVQNQMKYLREIQEDVEANGRKVNHLFSRWAALSGLLGRGDID